MTNTLKTTLLLGLLSGLLLYIGDLLGGPQGLVIAFGFALVTNFVSYWFSDKIALAMYSRTAGRPGAPAPPAHRAAWPGRPDCRCRRCTSSQTTRPTRLRPVATRRTRRWPRPRG